MKLALSTKLSPQIYFYILLTLGQPVSSMLPSCLCDFKVGYVRGDVIRDAPVIAPPPTSVYVLPRDPPVTGINILS